MRLEDMKSDIPETPDFIHKMIQNEVAKQIQDTKVMNLQRRKTWTIPKIAAVAAACTLAVSTAAYAGVNLYHWFLEKQGAYGVAVKIDADSMAKETMLPDEVPKVNLFARYIPKGMSWNDEYHLQYPEHEQTGGSVLHLFCWIKMIWDRLCRIRMLLIARSVHLENIREYT